MQNNQFKIIINIAILFWLFVWIYYLALNWGIFSVELKTNLGFAVITGYPFLFFALLGFLLLVILKYSYHIVIMQQKNKEKDNQTKTTLLEKDIEILKLKEVLFKMQTKDLSESSTALNALQEKLDDISNKITSEPKKPDKSPDNKSDNEEKKKG